MSDATVPPRFRLGCVSYLNSKPLIEPLVGQADVAVHFAVPAQLLEKMDGGSVQAALLPIVDYHKSRHKLWLVPAGAIGCDGPTLTVRIYSQVPPAQILALHADTDSHTSVILSQVILRERYGTVPQMVPLIPRQWHEESHSEHPVPQAVLLIGDKVVIDAPSERIYPYQLDLGEEWKRLTGLPFVFAMWMMRQDQASPELARRLAAAQRQGAEMTEELLDRYAARIGWPRDLARRYFTEYLRYDVSPRSREGVAMFYRLAAKHQLLTATREPEYFELSSPES